MGILYAGNIDTVCKISKDMVYWEVFVTPLEMNNNVMYLKIHYHQENMNIFVNILILQRMKNIK